MEQESQEVKLEMENPEGKQKQSRAGMSKVPSTRA